LDSQRVPVRLSGAAGTASVINTVILRGSETRLQVLQDSDQRTRATRSILRSQQSRDTRRPAPQLDGPGGVSPFTRTEISVPPL
jgi:hypothetical protein